MSEIDIQQIKQKSFLGAVALTSRTFILQVIAFISWFILGIILDPATFGIFYVVTAIVNFLNYFSDIGLAAALIQKKTEPDADDLATTFTIQEMLVFTIVSLALITSGWFSNFYNLDKSGLFLFRALVISFFISSLKTIPSIILERKLAFDKLICPQLVENLVFYITAIILAIAGWGISSFAWAALFRGVSGLIVLYLLAPWKPRIGFKLRSAKSLLSFGIPFQANSFLALIKDDLLTVYLGKILPLYALGYIGWAKKWAEIALRLIMDNIIRVTFPTFARLQHESKLLAKAIEKSIFFLVLFAFPIATGMLLIVKPMLEVVPKYMKWEPALNLFYLFTISAILATLSSPLVNALNALGKVKYNFYLMVMWTFLTWLLVPVLVSKYSYNGVALAALFIGLTSFVPLIFVQKIIKIEFIKQFIKPAIATLIMGLGINVLFKFISTPLFQVIGAVMVGGSCYIIAVYFLMHQELEAYMKLIKENIFKHGNMINYKTK